MGTKNTKFDAYFESGEKMQKVYPKKLSAKTFAHCKKSENLSFFVDNFA